MIAELIVKFLPDAIAAEQRPKTAIAQPCCGSSATILEKQQVRPFRSTPNRRSGWRPPKGTEILTARRFLERLAAASGNADQAIN